MAHTDWIDGTIRRPAAEYLDASDLRKLFGVSAEWIDDKVKDGTLPPPIRLTAKTLVYTWEHAVFLSLWIKLQGPGGSAGKKNDPG